MVLFTTLMGSAFGFYAINYAIYRYYFILPIKVQTLSQIIYQDLRPNLYQRLKRKITLKDEPYQFDLIFGINYKPIKAQYTDNQIKGNRFIQIFQKSKDSYNSITPLNNQIKPIDPELAQICLYRNKQRNLQIELCHELTEMNNIVRCIVRPFKYIKQSSQIQDIDPNSYYFIIVKSNGYIEIFVQLGENPLDIDFYIQKLNTTLKKDQTDVYNPVELTQEFLEKKYKHIKCIMLMQDYQFTYVESINNKYTFNNRFIYDKFIQNIERN